MRRIVILTVLLAATAFAGDFTAKKDVGGLDVALGIHPVTMGASLEEDAPVSLTIRVDDSHGVPMAGVVPAAWMSLRNINDHRPEASRCKEKIATFTAGNVFVRPEVDFNVFHVLGLNDDATITVVDPHFGFGGSRLLAMVELRARGEDWVLNDDSSLLFVSMPDAGAVAVIDTTTWKLLREIAVGEQPTRLALAPGGKFFWVAYRKGAAAIRANGSGIEGRIDTPEPLSEIVLTDGGRNAVLAGGKTVTFADTASMRARGSVTLPAAITSADVSPLSGKLYAATADGEVSVIDPVRARVVTQFATDGAAAQIRFDPRGRHGFIVVPSKNEVQIVDAVSDRIIQTADVDRNPDRVSFTDNLAYVRSLGSDVVLMIPLDKIGVEGAPVPVIDFPAGQKAFDKGPAPSIADGIVAAPGEAAVLVGNPADREIYYYREGMAAPIGHLENDGHAPRAVLVLDRSLRRSPDGEFRTSTRLPGPGTYDVAVFVDSPRIVTCFTMTVARNEALEARRRPPAVLEYGARDVAETRAGEPVRIAFRIMNPATNQPKSGLSDVTALLFAPGVVNVRRPAVARADGTYEVEVVPPAAGVYYFSVESPLAGLPLNNPNILILRTHG